ncbi:hypothetical protein [Acidovorax delafieldii]|uniref:hypothetical protein n=1 Tax=Acidovorax delafieldii TaxID=47920 RepID=UPI003ECF4A6F
MITFNQAFGGGSASGALGGWALPILASKSITIASKGKLQIAAMGGTGSGGFTGTGGEGATGANSAPWGVKIINVAVGDVVEFVIGAGGAGQTVAGSGIAGNATLVKLNGTTIMTCNPGEPGIKGASFPLVQTAPTATVVGADYWVPGLRSGQLAAGAVAFGGAAVDVFRTGLGRSTGTPGGSVGADGNSNGTTYTAPLALPSFELGISFLGLNTAGLAGVAGNQTTPLGGLFAGGAGAISGTNSGKGGRGAGGGGNYAGSISGAGGDGYAFIVFQPEA